MIKLVVRGNSLKGILDDGDEVEVEDVFSASVGDLIIFETVSKPLVIKILMGVPGNKINLHDNILSINEYKIELNNIQIIVWDDWAREKTIPEGYVVVMGTNKHSFDSKQFGFLPIDDIIGRVVNINRVNS